MLDISVSIVLYNNPAEDVINAVNSVLSSSRKIVLFLVDNSEEDHFRYKFQSPRIHYIFTGKNLGYGKAHNLAIERSKELSKYHLVLNPDVEFSGSVLDTLFQFMEKRSDIGLVMPKVLYRNGETQYLCKALPSPSDLFLRRFFPGPLKKLVRKKMERYELKGKDYNSIMDIPNLSGCFMFMRNEVLQTVGGFDERYFMYLEDTDLCRRINEYYRTVYFPGVSIIHGYSRASYKSFRLMKHHLVSSLSYFNKWGWLTDRSRNKINESVWDYSIMEKMNKERERIRRLAKMGEQGYAFTPVISIHTRDFLHEPKWKFETEFLQEAEL